MDTVTKALLQDVVRREAHSLLQYVSEAFPWTSPEEKDALAKILRMVQDEQQGIASLIRLFFKKHMQPPYIGPYPMTYTNLNYITLAHLLPMLIDYQKQRIGDLETYLSRIADADAAALVRTILEYKRRHLLILQQMTGTHGMAA